MVSQSVQDAVVEAVEYFPTAHSVHELAPAMAPVFVIEPAVHVVHDATFDAVEYLPAEHVAHAVAPELVPVFVIDPGMHTLQYDLPLPD